MDNKGAGGEQCVHCREVVPFPECPLSEVPLRWTSKFVIYR